MVWFCTDSKYFGNKFISILTGFTHLAIHVVTLVLYINESNHAQTSSSIVLEVLFAITNIVFCGLLLFGLFKNHARCIISYLIFDVVMLVLLVVGFFSMMFSQTMTFGITINLSNVVLILVTFVFFFVIRNYYLSLTHRPQNRNYA